jgi:ABC-type Fe3+/spermidine/putrescine transport system ATPase subunit
VAENVAYGLRIRGHSPQKCMQEAKKMLSFVELSEYAEAHTQDLSGGQQQRVALARALAINPDLILLDEPLSNIDQITKFDVATYLKNLFDSLHIPVILVTHQWEDARFLGQEIAIMIDGTIEQMGTFDGILQKPRNSTIKKLLSPYAFTTNE